ncbi:hypothetical protein H0H93_014691, partial [Arthromyces matolae]
ILTTVAQGSNGLAQIYAGRVICGIGTGGITAVAPAFVSECAPKEVRGRITGCFQVTVAIGVTISYFVNCKKCIVRNEALPDLISLLDGVGIHIHSGPRVWRIPFGFQIVPAGMLALGLLTIKAQSPPLISQESPRWLASKGQNEEALATLAYLRRESTTTSSVLTEMAEIKAAIDEEHDARKGLGWKEAFFGKGNFIRFVIAFVFFLLQQWAGPNSINSGIQDKRTPYWRVEST